MTFMYQCTKNGQPCLDFKLLRVFCPSGCFWNPVRGDMCVKAECKQNLKVPSCKISIPQTPTILLFIILVNTHIVVIMTLAMNKHALISQKKPSTLHEVYTMKWQFCFSSSLVEKEEVWGGGRNPS